MRAAILLCVVLSGCALSTEATGRTFVRDLVCIEVPGVVGEPGPCPPLSVAGCENANGTAVYAYHESEDISALCLAAVLE